MTVAAANAESMRNPSHRCSGNLARRYLRFMAFALGFPFCFAVHAAERDSGTAADVFATCGEKYEGPHKFSPIRSLYVPMRDGVRIALDVVLPEPLPRGGKAPTVLIMTRYWRSSPGAEPAAVVRFFASQGYAVVNGDVRGTGASFGIWRHHRNRDETWDFSDIMDWIIKQPWSDGRIVGWGPSYRANTVDWMVERNHPAFKVALSRFPDYDPYATQYFQGGMPYVLFGENWGRWVKGLDLNHNSLAAPGSPASRGVRPTDDDPDGRMLALAIAQRRDVPDVWQSLQQIVYRDDRPEAWGGWSMDDFGIHSWAKSVERSGTPILTWGSWMDGASSESVLRRFMTLSNPQRAIIGPWNHAATLDADPYRPVDAPVEPSAEQQLLQDLCFVKSYLDPGAVPKDREPHKLLTYYTMGEQRWKTTTTWPVPGTEWVRWNLQANHGLSRDPPSAQSGSDTYHVDFGVTTGKSARWQYAGADIFYPDRAEQDERLLTYTSEPLPHDMEITGHPVVSLKLRSTHSDGAFFVYLEDVAPDGRIYYITEGLLRGIHRKVSDDPPPYRVHGPYHSFKRADSMPLVPGELSDITFELLATSVLVRKGHRLRVAISGADKGIFQRIPETGDPVITVERNRDHISYINLPNIPRR